MIDIGTALDSEAILWVASGATVVQIGMWLLVFVAHVRAVVKKHILWPGKGKFILNFLFPSFVPSVEPQDIFRVQQRASIPAILFPSIQASCRQYKTLTPIFCLDEDHDA